MAHDCPPYTPVDSVSDGDGAEPIGGEGVVLGDHKKTSSVEAGGGANTVRKVDEDVQSNIGDNVGEESHGGERDTIGACA